MIKSNKNLPGKTAVFFLYVLQDADPSSGCSCTNTPCQLELSSTFIHKGDLHIKPNKL